MSRRHYPLFALCALLLAMLLLQGCAICREHPVACMAGSAIVAGSIAASLNSQHGSSRDRRGTQPVPCASNPALCQ